MDDFRPTREQLRIYHGCEFGSRPNQDQCNQTSTLWWSGSDWATSELYLTASGPTPWWFPSFTLLSGRTYVVKAKAVDQAGTEGSDSTNITFTFDNAKPTSLITSPLDASVRRLVTGLTGTAGDVSPGVVTNFPLQIKRLSDTKYYDEPGRLIR